MPAALDACKALSDPERRPCAPRSSAPPSPIAGGTEHRLHGLRVEAAGLDLGAQLDGTPMRERMGRWGRDSRIAW
jgi:hypothetical protein